MESIRGERFRCCCALSRALTSRKTKPLADRFGAGNVSTRRSAAGKQPRRNWWIGSGTNPDTRNYVLPPAVGGLGSATRPSMAWTRPKDPQWALALQSEFLAGDGSMGATLRAWDWTTSPLGRPEDWTSSLKTAIGLVLRAQAQIVLFWGLEFIAPVLPRCSIEASGPLFRSKWT